MRALLLAGWLATAHTTSQLTWACVCADAEAEHEQEEPVDGQEAKPAQENSKKRRRKGGS